MKLIELLESIIVLLEKSIVFIQIVLDKETLARRFVANVTLNFSGVFKVVQIGEVSYVSSVSFLQMAR